jgi:serine/threonine protein kinase
LVCKFASDVAKGLFRKFFGNLNFDTFWHLQAWPTFIPRVRSFCIGISRVTICWSTRISKSKFQVCFFLFGSFVFLFLLSVVFSADFGLSKVLDPQTKTMTSCGTAAWAAPEILKNARYTEKADVYRSAFSRLTSTLRLSYFCLLFFSPQLRRLFVGILFTKRSIRGHASLSNHLCRWNRRTPTDRARKLPTRLCYTYNRL